MTPPSASSDDLLARGGGQAAAAGVQFQQRIGGLFAAWMLSGKRLSPHLRLGEAQPVWFRFETEAPVDDLLVATSEGGFVAVQAKTTLSLSSQLASPFGQGVSQMVRHWLACEGGDGQLEWDRPLDPHRDRLILAVGPSASASIREDLPAAFEAFRSPASRPITQGQARALAAFQSCVEAVWPTLTQADLTRSRFAALVDVVGVLTYDFSDGEGSGPGALASALEPAADARASWHVLVQACADLMSRRGGADTENLRAQLRTLGVRLAAQPRYAADIAALRTHTTRVVDALSKYERIEGEGGKAASITRDCQAQVDAAAANGPLLIIGEPGAGKSGVLNALARSLRARHDVVTLAVDSHSVETLEGLTGDLKLQRPLGEVLEAWDGEGPAYLVIDALDAARGGRSERVFIDLIEHVVRLGGRWRVVASIRSFDLRMGQRFRALFPGAPPIADLANATFQNVRHVEVPSWTPGELDRLLKDAPTLRQILVSAPERLRDLVRVPFNTRLAADLVAGGVVQQAFQHIESQVELLRLYWDTRVGQHGVPLETCLRRVVRAMVEGQSLRAPRLDMAEPDPASFQQLEREGVLTPVDSDRGVQFRHHILFDYAASRVFLDVETLANWTPDERDGSLGLLLAPAIGFVLRGLWVEDDSRRRFWRLSLLLLKRAASDPVVAGIAGRTCAEMPRSAHDVGPLCDAIHEDESVAAALPHILSALAVRIDDNVAVEPAPWVALVTNLAKAPSRWPGSLRLLLFLLLDRLQLREQRSSLGVPARALLDHALSDPTTAAYVEPAIGFVAATFGSDAAASVDLLQRLFGDRFDTFGWNEVPALARNIEPIAAEDPAFAAEIYKEVYSREVEDRPTPMGRSQILPMRSNAQQDFDMARYELAEFFPKFLSTQPTFATRAYIDAVTGFIARRHAPSEAVDAYAGDAAGRTYAFLDDYSYIWAADPEGKDYDHDAEALINAHWRFLRDAPPSVALEVADLIAAEGRFAVLWARLFLVGALRDDELTDHLWPLAARPDFIASSDTRKDAIDLVARGYARRDPQERRAFEAAALAMDFSAYREPGEARELVLRDIFASIGAEGLETDAARAAAAVASDEPPNERSYRSSDAEWVDIEPFHWMADLNRKDPVNQALEAAIQHAEAAFGAQAGSPPMPSDGLLAEITALADAVAVSQAANSQLVRHAEGVMGQGLVKLVSQDLGQPLPTEMGRALLPFLAQVSASPSPIVEADTEAKFEEHTSWGGPAARVEAAHVAPDLCLRCPDLYPELEPLLDRLLNDAHPAARLQVVTRLLRIWDLDRGGFWARVGRVADTEGNTAVLSHLADSTLSRVLGAEPERVEGLVLAICARFVDSGARAAKLVDKLDGLLAALWLYQGRPTAGQILTSWLESLVDHAASVKSVLKVIRGALLRGLDGRGDSAIRQRALAFCVAALTAANSRLDAEFARTERDEASQCAIDQSIEVIDLCCRELYFAVRSGRATPTAELSPEGLAAYFTEITPALMLIGEHGAPRTVHYLLQLLEPMAPLDPAATFDVLAHSVLKSGRAFGYHYETLGADLLVKLVGIFLADHKAIFEDPTRRGQLVEVLEVFSSVGWPSARRLLYRLPELFQ